MATIASVISELLKEIGIPASLCGYKYARRGIELCLEDPEYLEGITKRLYPTLAKEFNSKTTRVERGIRHAIETGWDRGNVKVLDQLFAYSYSPQKGKPTNREFIATIADHIRLTYHDLLS